MRSCSIKEIVSCIALPTDEVGKAGKGVDCCDTHGSVGNANLVAVSSSLETAAVGRPEVSGSSSRTVQTQQKYLRVLDLRVVIAVV